MFLILESHKGQNYPLHSRIPYAALALVVGSMALGGNASNQPSLASSVLELKIDTNHPSKDESVPISKTALTNSRNRGRYTPLLDGHYPSTKAGPATPGYLGWH